MLGPIKRGDLVLFYGSVWVVATTPETPTTVYINLQPTDKYYTGKDPKPFFAHRDCCLPVSRLEGVLLQSE